MAGCYRFTNVGPTIIITTNLAKLLYSLVVHLYGLLIRVASVQDNKAKQWVKGRKNWRKTLSEKCNQIKNDDKIWVHCASYGEFEQGRPLIEAIQQKHPNYKIILTFFSPSGYEAFKGWAGADLVIYLPLDTKKNARDFMDLLQPKMAIFIKYEFWLHFLNQLKKNAVPTYLVSAVFKAHHPFFKWYGGIFRSSLNVFLKLFVQDKASAALLQSIGIQQVQVVGDTRFDRVLALKSQAYQNKIIEAFKGNSKLIIAGSTWPKDEELILKAFNKIKDKGVKLIIAPHEVETRFTINTIKKINEYNFKYSLYMQDPATDVDVMIIDTIGVLSKLYQYADAAYVGGGFNGGLHNVLEPSVHLIPVSFYGQNYEKFNEALDLMSQNVAQTALTSSELKTVWKQQLFDLDYCTMVQEKLQIYFAENGNVSEKVMQGMLID